MNKKVTGTLLLTSTLALLALGGTTTAHADEVTEDGNVYHVVESGDTLTKIADKYNLDFTIIHGNNDDLINHADLIFVDQKLLVGGNDFDEGKTTGYTVTTEEVVYVEETYVEEAYVEEAYVDYGESTQTYSAPATDDNWHRANRRMVETTDNYQWYWSNGYLGAYQFSPSTWNATASANGLDPNDTSPANQDAMADAYANDRYGGWHNVPTTGGW